MTVHISFDLDGTLIGCPGPVEPLGAIGRLLAPERLRWGTRRLFAELQKRGLAISIYTTSLRPHRQIRSTFRCHELNLSHVINGDDHAPIIKGTHRAKHPGAFGFHIHVDDAPIGNPMAESGVDVILVAPDCEVWVEQILKQVADFQQLFRAK
jgi:hypothetical protein